MKFIIKPFVSAGNLKFGTHREIINTGLNVEFKSLFEKTLDGVEFVIDYYYDHSLMLGYFCSSFMLRYVILCDPCEAIFEGTDLLAMNYSECLRFMRTFDENIEEEKYVGFTSYKYGIAIYAENATENPLCDIEAVTVGEKGYFETQV